MHGVHFVISKSWYNYSFNAYQTELGWDYQNAMIYFMVINFILPAHATHINVISMAKMQNCSNSIANALELLQPYAKPSICCGINNKIDCLWQLGEVGYCMLSPWYSHNHVILSHTHTHPAYLCHKWESIYAGDLSHLFSVRSMYYRAFSAAWFCNSWMRYSLKLTQTP